MAKLHAKPNPKQRIETEQSYESHATPAEEPPSPQTFDLKENMIAVYQDGSKYEGDLLQCDKKFTVCGNGTIKNAKGKEYFKGILKDDKAHGKGKVTFSDGSVYEG